MWKSTSFNTALERDFQLELVPRKVRMTRITMLLALGMVVGFGFLDPWALPAAWEEAWSVRGGMVAGILGCYALSFHPHYARMYSAAVVLVFSVLGGGVHLLVLLASPGEIAYDLYFIGLIMVATGLHALTFLNVVATTCLSAGFVAVYVVLAAFEQDYLVAGKEMVLVTNLFFFCSIVLISIIAQVMRDAAARENYLLRHSLARDVEFKEEARRRAAWIAENDALTGIGNRLYFEREAARCVVAAAAEGKYALLLFIDVNDFKAINDEHGHAVGDRALKFVAEQLYSCLQPDDVLARNGGDEFVACLVRERSEGVNLIVTRMTNQLAQGFRIRGRSIAIGASIGVACAPLDGTTLADALAVADREMYRIKELGLSGFSLSEGLRQDTAFADETPSRRRFG